MLKSCVRLVKPRCLLTFIRTAEGDSSVAMGKKPPVSIFGLDGRYVTALYSAASSMNQLDDVEKHLRALQPELSKPKIVDFIESSLMSAAAKSKLLKEIAKEVGMPDAAVNFLGIVAENGRLKLLRRMITKFLMVMAAHRNEAQCEVITAQPLDEATRSSLMGALQKLVKDNKKIQLTEKVDPSILGGMIVGVEDKHIDMSISKKIQVYRDILQQAI